MWVNIFIDRAKYIHKNNFTRPISLIRSRRFVKNLTLFYLIIHMEEPKPDCSKSYWTNEADRTILLQLTGKYDSNTLTPDVRMTGTIRIIKCQKGRVTVPLLTRVKTQVF